VVFWFDPLYPPFPSPSLRRAYLLSVSHRSAAIAISCKRRQSPCTCVCGKYVAVGCQAPVRIRDRFLQSPIPTPLLAMPDQWLYDPSVLVHDVYPGLSRRILISDLRSTSIAGVYRNRSTGPRTFGNGGRLNAYSDVDSRLPVVHWTLSDSPSHAFGPLKVCSLGSLIQRHSQRVTPSMPQGDMLSISGPRFLRHCEIVPTRPPFSWSFLIQSQHLMANCRDRDTAIGFASRLLTTLDRPWLGCTALSSFIVVLLYI